MNELIGIKNLNSFQDINDIKRELLIFDKILIVGLYEWTEVIEKQMFKDSRSILEQKGLISLNDFVIYQGYLFMNEQINKSGGLKRYYERTKNDNLEFRNQNLEYLIQEKKVIFDYNELTNGKRYNDIYKQINPIIESKLNDSTNQDLEKLFSLCNLCHDLKSRIISTSCDESRFTAIPCDNSIYSIEGITNTKAETYNLILKDFPIVEIENVSWQQIFDFKNDPQVYNSIWGLRNWITNISKSNKTSGEIEEEYRYLKNKYEQAIKIHKLKISNSLFQTSIQTTAELIENVAKLRLRKLSDLLFKFNENKISLMETELKSDGSQFSYLFKIKNKFSK